jgi:hypothetical protein
VTLTGNSLPMSIMRMRQGGDASEKRYQKAFPKINRKLMRSP